VLRRWSGDSAMASPGQLVQTMAAALGISIATVAQYDRQLSEKGLRSKGGRGSSAATVTAHDAANLLIVIAASPLAGPTMKEAARTCEMYGSLKANDKGSFADSFPQFGLRSLAGLPKRHSFQEALSTLIDAAARGEDFKIPDEREPISADSLFEIEIEGPRPWAKISADGSIGKGKGRPMARLVYAQEWRAQLGDLYQSRHISFATVRALGSLLAGNLP
jgi:hypothetical protein